MLALQARLHPESFPTPVAVDSPAFLAGGSLLGRRRVRAAGERVPAGGQRDTSDGLDFGAEFAQNLRYWKPRQGSRWHLDEIQVVVGRVTHWLWRAINGHNPVLDVFLQQYWNTSAATVIFNRLPRKYDVPETVFTDRLAICGTALRELPVLDDVDHQRVIRAARGNNLIEQSHRLTRRQERGQLESRQVKRAQESLDLPASIAHLHRSRPTISPETRPAKLEGHLLPLLLGYTLPATPGQHLSADSAPATLRGAWFPLSLRECWV